MKPVVEINRSFVDGVERGGGLPFVLPVLASDAAGDLVDALDGIVLTGGIDVDPAVYGAERSPHVTRVDPDRDAFEIALVQASRSAGRPVLGLCRGCQVLDVALGGTLVQHLPDLSDQPHDLKDRTHEVVHDVSVAPGSLLARITGGGSVGVNSLHHQAVDRLGDGLTATAWSGDGVVEAIENESQRLLGVQWHPELMLDHHDGHLDLFEWVVEAAATVLTAGDR